MGSVSPDLEAAGSISPDPLGAGSISHYPKDAVFVSPDLKDAGSVSSDGTHTAANHSRSKRMGLGQNSNTKGENGTPRCNLRPRRAIPEDSHQEQRRAYRCCSA